MPKPAPLSPGAAARTLAHRFTRRADSLRQLHTRFGARSRRVFLVWTLWTGAERGEGDEQVLHRVELLPTPRIEDLGAVALRPWSAGVVPEGMVRVDQISCGAYTRDNLMGLKLPSEYRATQPVPSQIVDIDNTGDPRLNARTDFFWEVQEDDRSGEPQPAFRFRPYSEPTRKETQLWWIVMLERIDDDSSRDGHSKYDEEDV